jgi:hypothetical protein
LLHQKHVRPSCHHRSYLWLPGKSNRQGTTTTTLKRPNSELLVFQEHQVEAVLHIFGWIASIFVSCLGGQLLMDSVPLPRQPLKCFQFSTGFQSTSVADAAYGSKWYEADVRTRNDLILVILRSRKSLFVSTGSFNVLCLALFVSVSNENNNNLLLDDSFSFQIMRMSYSILTLLS